MCKYPHKINDIEVACRTCIDCLTTRKNTWIARAMAEKATAGETFAITLSYAPLPCGKEPLGARVFRYKDIQNWLKAVREAYYRCYGERGGIRYIVCGERGSKNTKRIHWHVILYANKPIGPLGEWYLFSTGEKLEKPILETNLHWTLWAEGGRFHGHCKLQKPAKDGIGYVVKYALEDQFTGEKSKGKRRFVKSHNHASAMFRMSKQPPIGLPFLEHKFQRLREKGQLPPTLDIKVPDGGYWHLHGDIRETVIQWCHEINEEIKERTGEDAPQWGALLASVSKPEYEENGKPNNDKEGLIYGQIEELPQSDEQQREEFDQLQNDIFRRELAQRSKRTATECGRIYPCGNCEATTGDKDLASYREQEREAFAEWCQKTGRKAKYKDVHRYPEFGRWCAVNNGAGKGCQRKSTWRVQRAIKAVRGIDQLDRKVAGKRDYET